MKEGKRLNDRAAEPVPGQEYSKRLKVSVWRRVTFTRD